VSDWLGWLKAQFILNFIDGDRWKYLWNGLGATLTITFGAVLIGIALGVVISIIRSTHDKTIETMQPGLAKTLLRLVNAVCKLYLTVIRGTPIVVQLMISYYLIFVSSNNGILIGILTFGINSGAYVAEIFRAGIMSIDAGQTEAGRSLGFNFVQTTWYIIIPQAFKNVLPALLNEFIALMKETSVAGYIALQDLAKGAYIIIGRTYSPFMPLIAIALIYLLLVQFFTWLVARLERRLRASDH
jgi:arginine/lysine/histidine transport system permease protein